MLPAASTTVPARSGPSTRRASGAAPGHIGSCVWPGDGCQAAGSADSRGSPAVNASTASRAIPTRYPALIHVSPERGRRRDRCRRLFCALPSPSQPLQQSVVLGMRADPEPDDRVSLPEPHGTPVHANANRVDGLARMNPLELDTRVTW